MQHNPILIIIITSLLFIITQQQITQFPLLQPFLWKQVDAFSPQLSDGIFTFIHSYSPQLSVQPVYPQQQIVSPLLISAESKHASNSSGTPFVYVNVRYKDGSLLPAWLRMQKNLEWKSECLVIPNFGHSILDILVVAGAYDINIGEESDENEKGISMRNIQLNYFYSDGIYFKLNVFTMFKSEFG